MASARFTLRRDSRQALSRLHRPGGPIRLRNRRAAPGMRRVCPRRRRGRDRLARQRGRSCRRALRRVRGRAPLDRRGPRGPSPAVARARRRVSAARRRRAQATRRITVAGRRRCACAGACRPLHRRPARRASEATRRRSHRTCGAQARPAWTCDLGQRSSQLAERCAQAPGLTGSINRPTGCTAARRTRFQPPSKPRAACRRARRPSRAQGERRARCGRASRPGKGL